jgi:ABC-type multidrug transport system fused ATPase/permease subunit
MRSCRAGRGGSEFFHFDALDRLTCSTFAACRPGDVDTFVDHGVSGSREKRIELARWLLKNG